jgi:ectoine hydroxylase-related dioxygenase (phytanoyl-CoA dioxygenase family)
MYEGFNQSSDFDVADFHQRCSRETNLTDYPHACEVRSKIVVYDAERLQVTIDTPRGVAALRAEWTRCLASGPGIFLLCRPYLDLSIVDRMTEVFRRILALESADGQRKGDHFGNNERIWNSLQKACQLDPGGFIDYYGNPWLHIACEAWLGPCYQVTAQVNNVKPGSPAQTPHRDYHLGFQSPEIVAQFPIHAQVMSQYLTLQGAVAHGDMPLIQGPTCFLPYSHHFPGGYQAGSRPEVTDYFREHHVQIPLSKGDMVFFSPALFHGAGSNSSQQDRIANLLQISSAMGRTMESIDHVAMLAAAYPVLLDRIRSGEISPLQMEHVLATIADGYSFPTNLDSDPPLGGKAPATGQQIVRHGLEQQCDWKQVDAELQRSLVRRRATCRQNG